MTFLHYRGFRPTSHYIGLVWLGRSICGIEIAPDAVGFVVWDMWIGWVSDEKEI